MEYTDLEELLVVLSAFGVSPCARTSFYEVTRHFAVFDDCLDIRLSGSEDHRRCINLVLGLYFVNVASK